MATRTPAKPFHEYNLRLPVWLFAHLRQHAHDRRVFINELITDVLQTWNYLITDPTDPVFFPERLGVERATLPRERYLGYLPGLGFNIEDLLDEPMQLAGRDARPLSPGPGERTWNQ